MLTKVLPEDNDESVEYVEPIADILDEPVGGELEHHLSREDDGEHHVRQLNNLNINIVFSVYSAFFLEVFPLHLACLLGFVGFCLSFCLSPGFFKFCRLCLSSLLTLLTVFLTL